MDWTGKIVKVVFSDDGKEKVVFGKVIEDTEFLLNISAERTNAPVTIGKRAIIKVSEALS